ncbi:MAG: methyltransferase [Pseudomonadota bacterium]|nr:methyltransferase [Pseudomonadota bacterium]
MPIPSQPAPARQNRRAFGVQVFGALVAGSTVARGQPTAAAGVDPALAAVLAGPQRSAASKARDVWRHPAETLRFFDLRADQHVLELSPGSGWYTEILAPYLRERGRLYTAHYAINPPDPDAGHQQARRDFEAKLAATPMVYDRVVSGSLPTTGFTDLRFDRPLDAVLTFRNLHNWVGDGHLADRLRIFHAALKPGGVLGVEEHRAAPGTPLVRQVSSGYLTEALVIEQARAAGFELSARSEINANPRDTRLHPHGVWSLPPNLSGAPEGSAARAQALAIGESDRMTLRFIKFRP